MLELLVHAHASDITQYNTVLATGQWRSQAGKVTNGNGLVLERNSG